MPKKEVKYRFYLFGILATILLIILIVSLKKEKKEIVPPEVPESNKLFEGLQEANRLYYSGKFIDAAEKYKAIADKYPDNYPAQIGLGNSYIKLGIHDEAIKAFNKTLSFKYHDFRTFYGLGLANYNKEGYMEAYGYLKKAYGLNPNDKYTAIYYVNTLNVLGMYDEAIRLSTMELDKKSGQDYYYRKIAFAYLLKNDFQNAALNAEKSIELSQKSPNNHLSLAVAKLNLGETEKALAEFNNALSFQKSNFIYEGLAFTYYIRNDVQNYEKFKKLANYYIKDSFGLSLLGFAMLQNGKHDKAIELFNEAIADNPGYYLPYLGLAKAYMSLGQNERAVENLEKAVKLNDFDVQSKELLHKLKNG